MIKDIIEKMNNRIKYLSKPQRNHQEICSYCENIDEINGLKYILPFLENSAIQEAALIKALVKLYKINQNINNIIAEFNHTAKEKIGLNVLDLMNEIEIKKLLETHIGKKWEEIKEVYR